MEFKDIVGEYLRGYMEVEGVIIRDGDVEETSVYLYFDGFTARVTYARYDSLLRDGSWGFEEVKEAPERDSRYKAIGEYVESIVEGEKEEEDAEMPTDVNIIKTKTKILDFRTQYFDSHYPSSIWGVM